MEEPYMLIPGGLVEAAPGLALWILALILSSVLMQRGGGRPEHFLFIGSCLLLASSILSVFQPLVRELLLHAGMRASNAALMLSFINLFLWLIRLPGIICIFYAVWKKFNKREELTAK